MTYSTICSSYVYINKVEREIINMEKKLWSNPEVAELGVEDTLCDEYDTGIMPSHGDDGPSAPGNSGKFDCPYCTHSCPNENTRNEHIERIHAD